MNGPANRSESGFTLVEVLISMMIFAFGILAVINMQLVSTATNLKGRNMTEGIVVAQAKIEELMQLDYDDLQLADDEADADPNQAVAVDPSLDKDQSAGANKSDHEDLSNPLFNLYWNVRPDYPFDNTKTVRVIVRWTEKSINHRFALDMVKSEGD